MAKIELGGESISAQGVPRLLVDGGLLLRNINREGYWPFAWFPEYEHNKDNSLKPMDSSSAARAELLTRSIVGADLSDQLFKPIGLVARFLIPKDEPTFFSSDDWSSLLTVTKQPDHSSLVCASQPVDCYDGKVYRHGSLTMHDSDFVVDALVRRVTYFWK